MRELKFRQWQKATKHYVYFSLSKGVSLKFNIEPGLEQYTGLRDKNGKGIYEGDIIRYAIWLRGAAKELICTKVVKWWSGEEEEWPCCTTSGFSLPQSEDGYEVIGNIHENPELLEHKG